MNNNKIIFIIATCFIVLTTIIVLFFLNGEYFDTCSRIKSDKFGDFGSFYGGFIGTIIALISLVILYWTYYYQRTQTELFIINKLYDDIIKDIGNIEYKDYVGIKALFNFDSEHDNPNKPENRSSVMNQLSLILTLFENLIITTNKSRYINRKTKEINLIRIYLMYNANIIWPVYESIYNKLYEDFKDADGKSKSGLRIIQMLTLFLIGMKS